MLKKSTKFGMTSMTAMIIMAIVIIGMTIIGAFIGFRRARIVYPKYVLQVTGNRDTIDMATWWNIGWKVFAMIIVTDIVDRTYALDAVLGKIEAFSETYLLVC